jgi:hypothetical protein
MAITVEQLRIYEKYRGDDDGLSRAGTAKEKAAFVRDDWARITAMIQSIALAMSDLASSDFKAKALDSAAQECASESAAALLLELARSNLSTSTRTMSD